MQAARNETPAMSHTPTPWQIKNEYERTVIIGNVDGPDDGRYHYVSIADTNADDLNELDVDAGNAAHIVRCVNAHDELRNALADLLDAEKLDDDYATLIIARIRARAVLAKVQP